MKIKNPMEDRILYFVVYTVIILFLLVILYPIIFIISASFSEGSEVQLGRVYLWPVKPTLEGYRAVFSHRNIMTGYRNTILYTLGGTLINVVVTVLCAYPLSRRDMPIRGFFVFLFVFTMFFGGGLIPTYLLVNSLGMVNTFWALLIPGAMSVYNMIITRTFFQNGVPHELLEASQIDGCSDARYFFSILLPLSQAVISVISLYYAVAHWNSYFSALIYIRDASKYPLQMVLREILFRNQQLANVLDGDPKTFEQLNRVSQLLRYVVMIVASVPMLCAYPFVQKHFVKGVMIGSVKG